LTPMAGMRTLATLRPVPFADDATNAEFDAMLGLLLSPLPLPLPCCFRRTESPTRRPVHRR
jgi:hypothetical protein